MHFLPSGTFSDCVRLAPEALFSSDGKHRYVLTRRWSEGKRWVTFIGLNPSTADATNNDPTVRRCIEFARSWGYDGMIMMNIFALRSTDPKALYHHGIDPVGPENDRFLMEAAKFSETRICCWGNHGKLLSRGWLVARMLHKAGIAMHALTVNTKTRLPGHPLYLPAVLNPQPWEPSGPLSHVS